MTSSFIMKAISKDSPKPMFRLKLYKQNRKTERSALCPENRESFTYYTRKRNLS